MAWFKCWCPSEEEPQEANVEGFDAQDAAETYAEDEWPYNDNPAHQTVHVRDAHGEMRVYDVQAAPTVDFVAAEVEVPKTEPWRSDRWPTR